MCFFVIRKESNNNFLPAKTVIQHFLYVLTTKRYIILPCTWNRLMGELFKCGISIVRRHIKNPRTSCERKFNFLSCDVLRFLFFWIRRWYHHYKIEGLSNIEVIINHTYIYAKISFRISRFLTKWSFCATVFACQVPNVSCHIIFTMQYFSHNHYFIFIVNENKRTGLTMPLGYGIIETKRKKKLIYTQRKRELKTWTNIRCRQWGGKNWCGTIINFGVNQYLKYENDKQQHLFDHAFAVSFSVEFVFSNKHDATKNNPWGGRRGILSKLWNDVNINGGNNSSMLRGITKKVSLAKVDGVKFEPNLKGRRKTGNKNHYWYGLSRSSDHCWYVGVGYENVDCMVTCRWLHGSWVASIGMNLCCWDLYC